MGTSISRVLFDSVAHRRRGLDDEIYGQAIAARNRKRGGWFRKFLLWREALRALPVALKDCKVPEAFRHLIVPWRQILAEHGCPAKWPVAYGIRPGFTLKARAPTVGLCRDAREHLNDCKCKLVNGEPTKPGVAFWVPRLVKGSVSKTYADQIALLAEIRAKVGLPSHHLSGLGSAALNTGLILAHYKRTGERVPLDGKGIRTDSFSAAGGIRLEPGWGGNKLYCSYWYDDVGRDDRLGVFALGVEELGNS